MSVQRRDVGRVIFAQGKSEWIVLTLSSHVDNVVRLVEMWDPMKAYLNPETLELNATRSSLIRAARIHDSAKPAKFRLRYNRHPFRPGVWQWEYSFAGHRFEVFDDDLYAQTLARLHHEYSVEGITTAVAKLRVEGVPHAENLPLDLYTLEMCDQIEATVACAAVGSEAPEERVFMDFAFGSLSGQAAAYTLEPFPFQEMRVCLTVEYAELKPPTSLINTVEQATSDGPRHRGLQELQDWLLKEFRQSALQIQEVTLCPLIA
jgi:hypothetical protein